MSIMKKFSNLISSHLNNLLDSAEDPQKLRAQEKLDLEDKKQQAHKLIIQTKAQINLAQTKKQEVDYILKKLKEKASELEQNHNLEKQNLIQEQINTLLATQDHIIKQINIHNNNLKISELGAKKITTLIKNLHVKYQNNNILEDSSSFDNFDRMAEKIEQQEFELEALEELLQEQEKGQKGEKPQALDKFSDPNFLDQEIAKIKKQLKE